MKYKQMTWPVCIQFMNNSSKNINLLTSFNDLCLKIFWSSSTAAPPFISQFRPIIIIKISNYVEKIKK